MRLNMKHIVPLKWSVTARLCRLAFFLCCGIAAADPTPGKEKIYIPDEKTAIAVGKAVLQTLYDEKAFKAEEPYHAILSDGV
jgi:hypothetical protein